MKLLPFTISNVTLLSMSNCITLQIPDDLYSSIHYDQQPLQTDMHSLCQHTRCTLFYNILWRAELQMMLKSAIMFQESKQIRGC